MNVIFHIYVTDRMNYQFIMRNCHHVKTFLPVLMITKINITSRLKNKAIKKATVMLRIEHRKKMKPDHI